MTDSLATRPAVPDRRLLDLQALDLAIDRLRSRQTELGEAEDVREARRRVRELETKLGELKLSLGEVATDQRRLEGDVDSMGLKVDAERKRLFDGSVANAKELQSIEAEVSNLRARISVKEDQLLELMERREQLEGELVPLEAELAEARGHIGEVESASGRELDEVEAALKEREAERRSTAEQIESEILDLYEDLRRQKKGVGAVALVDGVCQGCHQKLSPVYLDQLKRKDGVLRCEYCRRILIVS